MPRDMTAPGIKPNTDTGTDQLPVAVYGGGSLERFQFLDRPHQLFGSKRLSNYAAPNEKGLQRRIRRAGKIQKTDPSRKFEESRW